MRFIESLLLVFVIGCVAYLLGLGWEVARLILEGGLW